MATTKKHDGDYSLTSNRDHGNDNKHELDYSLTGNRDYGDDNKQVTGTMATTIKMTGIIV